MVEQQEPSGSSSSQQDSHQAYYEQQVAKLEAVIENILHMKSDSDDEKILAAIELLLKLTHNISKSPTEAKYRTVRTTIPKIQTTLFSLMNGIAHELVVALGFIKVDEEHYTFVGDYLKVLRKGQALLEKAIEPMKVKKMSPEERAKYELMQEQKRIYQEQQKKKREQLEEAKRLQQADRKEKAQEGPAKQSVANKLAFGANVVKFEPPKNQGG